MDDGDRMLLNEIKNRVVSCEFMLAWAGLKGVEPGTDGNLGKQFELMQDSINAVDAHIAQLAMALLDRPLSTDGAGRWRSSPSGVMERLEQLHRRLDAMHELFMQLESRQQEYDQDARWRLRGIETKLNNITHVEASPQSNWPSDVVGLLEFAKGKVIALKLNDRSEQDRRHAILATEIEKVVALAKEWLQ